MANPGVRIELNTAGVRALLRSDAILQDLVRRGEAIANAAGGSPDFTVNASFGKNRARVHVVTETPRGRRLEARDRVLTRAIDAGRA
jgi:hypothetical protein